MEKKEIKLDNNIKENVLTRVGVTRPHTVFVLIAVVVMLGVFAFSGLRVELFPNMNLPYVIIMSSAEGDWVQDLNNDELALTVTEMYSSIQETTIDMLVPNTKSIQRMSMKDGSSAMFIEFNDGVDSASARRDVESALNRVEYRDPFNNKEFNKSVDLRAMLFGMVLMQPAVQEEIEVIKSGHPEWDTLSVDQQNILLAPVYAGVNATVNVLEPLIRSVSFSLPIAMSIDPSMMPVFSFSFKADPSFSTSALVEALKKTTGVAQVSTSAASSSDPYGNFELLDGENAVTVSIQKNSNAVTTDTVANIMSTLANFKSKNTAFDYTVTVDQGGFIDNSVGSVLDSLLIGALLAIVIIFLFMRSWKMTLAIGIAIPLSIVGTFILMHFMGIGLNLISMSGLALAVGLLVDNSIIILENIFRLRKNGMSVRDSAIKGASQIFAAIVAATLTTVAVFVPMFFVTGMIMQVFMDLVYVMVFALLASLIVAIMFLPSIVYSFKLGESAVIEVHNVKYPQKWYGWILGWIAVSLSFLWKYIKVAFIATGKFFKHIDKALTKIFKKPMEATNKGYNAALRFSIKNKFLTVALAIGLFVASIFAMLSNGFVIMPSMDTGEFGATISINAAYEGFDENNDSDITKQEMYNEVRRHANVLHSKLKSADVFGDDVTISMSYKTNPGLLDTNTGVSLSINFVLPNDTKMSTDAASQLAYDKICEYFEDEGIYNETPTDADADTYMVSRVSISSSMMGLGSSEIAVTITGETQQELNVAMDKIKETLKANAEINKAIRPFEDAIGEGTLVHIDKRLTASLSITLHEGYSISKIQGLVTAEIDALFDSTDPQTSAIFANIEQQADGFGEQMNDTVQQMSLALIVGLILIYLVMVALLRSFKMPFIVLITVPLAFTGGFLLLAMCGMPLSMPAMIGLLLLMGVIINNGIVMLDYVNQAREGGLKIKDAVITGANVRARPILMTALSTIFALIPLAIGTGASGGMMAPIAIVSIGGFIYGTFTSLLVIPAFYCIFVRREKRGIINEENNCSQLENEQKLVTSEGVPAPVKKTRTKTKPNPSV